MRILFPIHVWRPEGKGGTELHAHSLATALARRGHQVRAFARTGRPARPEYEVVTEEDGPIDVTRINNCFQETYSFEWVYRNRAVHEAFERELDSFRPELVHVHHLVGLSTTLLEAVKARGLPLVMTLHDFWTVCPRGQRMTRELELCETIERTKCAPCLAKLWPHAFPASGAAAPLVDLRGRLAPPLLAEWDRHIVQSLDLCDVLVCPSAFHRERMLDFPLDPSRILALPHGLDRRPFEKVSRTRSNRTRIGFIGSVIPVKGVHVLVEAFERLGRDDVTLEIHGEFAPFHERDYGEQLRARAAGNPRVRFHGAYEPEDVASVLANLDLLVVPSLWWESFCLTIREGLLAGVPVIASDLGAMREALDGERDGLLFAPGDARDLAAKISLLLDDPELRARLGRRQGTVKSMETYVREIEAVYADAKAGAAARRESLVVAPSSFPKREWTTPARWPEVDPGAIRLATRVKDAAGVRLATRAPSAGRLVVGVEIGVSGAGPEPAVVDVEIDFSGLAKVVGFAERAPSTAAPPTPAESTVATPGPATESTATTAGPRDAGATPPPVVEGGGPAPASRARATPATPSLVTFRLVAAGSGVRRVVPRGSLRTARIATLRPPRPGKGPPGDDPASPASR